MGHCSKCGAELNPEAKFCSNCGASQAENARAESFEPENGLTAGAAAPEGGSAQPAQPAPANVGQPAGAPPPPVPPGARVISPRKIETSLIKSILAAFCCCIPFGIIGIIYAVQADKLLKKNDLAAAAEAGHKSDLWSNLAIGVGLTIYLLITALMIVEIKDMVM